MKTILILANNSVGLYNFRLELIQRLLDLKYKVYFSLPESAEDDKVRKLIAIGARHIQTFINRRGSNPIQDAKLVMEYRRIIKQISPDLIMTYTIKPNVYGSFAASQFRIPVIMNITGIGSSLSQGNLKGIVKRLYKYSCSRAHYVFFQNQNNFQFFQEFKLITNEQKTAVLPGSGVNLQRYSPKDQLREAGSRISFLFIGRIMKEKGIEEYMEAASRTSRIFNNVQFQVLGDFEDQEYKNIFNENPNIRYLGTSDDVRNEIRDADCIVHPSYHEGMSNVLLESAAMGKPLIASDIPGCREIVEDGYNGYLFESRSVSALLEKVDRFIQLSWDARVIMGNNSRNKVEKEFDREIVIQSYIKRIKEIIG